MTLGPAELLIIVIGFVPVALGIWAIVDAAKQPDAAWDAMQEPLHVDRVDRGLRSGLRNRASFLSMMFLASIRSQLNAAAT